MSTTLMLIGGRVEKYFPITLRETHGQRFEKLICRLHLTISDYLMQNKSHCLGDATTYEPLLWDDSGEPFLETSDISEIPFDWK